MNSNRWGRIIGTTALAALLYAMPVSAQVVPECSGDLPSTARLPDLMNIIPIHVHVQEAHRAPVMFTVGLANVGHVQS